MSPQAGCNATLLVETAYVRGEAFIAARKIRTCAIRGAKASDVNRACAEADRVLAVHVLFFRSSSRSLSTRRCTLPVVVIGKASMNSISLGYS